jgi:hypothetical protein
MFFCELKGHFHMSMTMTLMPNGVRRVKCNTHGMDCVRVVGARVQIWFGFLVWLWHSVSVLCSLTSLAEWKNGDDN